MPEPILPARHRPDLPLDRFLAHGPPAQEQVPMDVAFVGGGPAGLAGAIHLARLLAAARERGDDVGDVEIAVLEKSEAWGQHCLSGAVVDPRALRALFPGVPDAELPLRRPVAAERVYLLTRRRAIRVPTPPPMRNHGNHVASLCEIVRWMGERAEAMGVNCFTGYPAGALLLEGDRVVGVRTTPSGLTREGAAGPGYVAPTDVTARVTALAEGTRGSLTQAWRQWRGVASPNPQIYALGVKEVWEVRAPVDAVVHTMGWPLPRDTFGGSFLYPMADDLVAVGLVVGLDHPHAGLDVHELLQRMKTHPFFRRVLEGGEMVEWGAKTIPEGGLHALPDRLSGDGVLLLGDAAGFVDVASLKGIHYAMQSGIEAAETIFGALRQGDASAAALAAYDERMRASWVHEDLWRRRNMRLAFHRGFWRGSLAASLMVLTGGRFPGGRFPSRADADVPRRVEPHEPFAPDGTLTFSKTDGVYKAGNQTRDDIPSHLLVGGDVPPEVADLYARLCPAGVYERQGDRLVVNAPNCVDCKATDVLGPRWTPREGGSGPHYRRM